MPLIRRIQPTSDQLPPWTGLAFIDKIGTDEFYEHLKKKYPECNSQWERKHMAAIEFLMWELQEARSPSLPKEKGQRSLASPDSSIHPNDGESSHGDSPGSSPTSSEFPELSISKDNVQATIELKEIPVAVTNSTLARSNGMTQYVFNAANGQEHEPRKRRKMSPDERRAYKKMRRRGGACDKCRRNKEKCIHNLIDGADLLKTIGSKGLESIPKPQGSSILSSRPLVEHQTKGRPGVQIAHGSPDPPVNDNEAERHHIYVPPSASDAGWTSVVSQGALQEEAGYVNNPLPNSSAHDGASWTNLDSFCFPQYSDHQVHQMSPTFQNQGMTRYGYPPGHDEFPQE